MNSKAKNIIAVCLNEYGYVDLVARGKSMYPAIKDGDTVRIIPREKYNENEIIAFWNKHEKIVIHRIIIASNDRFFTKGDNNTEFDRIVRKNDVLGVVLKMNN